MPNFLELSRPVFFKIPFIAQLSMYLLFGMALLIFTREIVKKAKFIKEADPTFFHWKNFHWKNFIFEILFQSRVSEKAVPALFHGSIFFGFVILVITTIVVGIHADTPFEIFKGPLYIILSFLSDIAGVVILLGVGIAFFRRYILKLKTLTTTQKHHELGMYLFIILLILQGYLLEAIRIKETDAFLLEQYISPIGTFFARLLHAFTTETLQNHIITIYQFIWLVHMINTMFFIAILPTSKFSHMIWGAINALITKKHTGAILTPMNFEVEDCESFGLNNKENLTAKQRLDLLACVECGRCEEVCPALLSGKKLSPKKIIVKIRDHLFTNKHEDQSFFGEHPLFEESELEACTTCGACMEKCPMNIHHVPIIMEAKRYKALTLGEIPDLAQLSLNNIKNSCNPWGINPSEKMNWAKDYDIKIATKDEEFDYLYFVGCAGSFDPSNQIVVRNTLSLLKHAGLNVAVLGTEEPCCGDSVRRLGDEYTFSQMALSNIALLNEYKFKTLVTHCPHGFHTIKKEYPLIEKISFDVLHHTEVLAELIKVGKLKPTKRVDLTCAYHDPCYIGRHDRNFDSARYILHSIPGMQVHELKSSKESALCCGMGGGNMWHEISEGEHLSLNRLREFAKEKQSNLCTACSYCLINFNSTKKEVPECVDLRVDDVATYLAASVL